VGWRHHPIGRNMMAKSAVLAGMLGLSLLVYLIRLPAWIWLGGMYTLGAMIWWRNWISWRLQHTGRRPEHRP